MKQCCFNFEYDTEDYKSVFDFGDYVRKASMYLDDDSIDKWKIVCKADEIQNTLHPTLEIYAKRLNTVAEDFSKYLEEKQNNFII